MENELTEFLKQRKEKEEEEKANWNKIKEDWITTLDNFLNKIKLWLSEPAQENLLTIIETKGGLNEEALGHYSAPMLIIRADKDTIKIIPVGRFVLGAKGRVNMLGYGKKKGFLLVDEGWIYFHEKRGYGEPLGEPLTKELFIRLFMEMLKK